MGWLGGSGLSAQVCSLDSLCLSHSPWACSCAEIALKEAGTRGLPWILAFIHFQLYPHLAPLLFLCILVYSLNRIMITSHSRSESTLWKKNVNRGLYSERTVVGKGIPTPFLSSVLSVGFAFVVLPFRFNRKCCSIPGFTGLTYSTAPEFLQPQLPPLCVWTAGKHSRKGFVLVSSLFLSSVFLAPFSSISGKI